MSRSNEDGTIPFQNILNFRDVGAYINHLSSASRPILKPGLLHRSARPDAATPSDRTTLTQTLAIRTIIDLRTPTEHLEALKKHQTTPQSVPTAPGLAPADPKHPLRLPGLRYKDTNLNGDAYTSHLLQRLTWPQTLHLYTSYILGYRTSAIAILATNVMAPRGLSGLAIDTLTFSSPIIASLFNDTLSDATAYPVLVHCTQGKDRTGLVVLLLLLLCGVHVGSIESDYMASQAGLEPEREQKVAEVRGVGFPEEFADCEVGWVGKVVEWMEGQGGVEAYLKEAGVGREAMEKIKGLLIA